MISLSLSYVHNVTAAVVTDNFFFSKDFTFFIVILPFMFYSDEIKARITTKHVTM